MKARGYWVAVASVLVASASLAAESLNVTAQVDKNEVQQGEMLTYSITIAGTIDRTPKVQLNSFEGFQVVSTGQSQQIQVAPGKSRLTLTLRYTLAPTAVGTHTLGPVKVEYKGESYQTQPIEVKVVKKEGSAEEAPAEEPPVLEGGVVL